MPPLRQSECSERESTNEGFVEQRSPLNDRQRDELEALERRRAPRISANDPAVMRVIRPDCSELSNVRVLDVSVEGFKLLVPQPLDPGSTVQIRLNTVIVLAEVRYCVPCGEGFHAGVLIFDAFPLRWVPIAG